MAENTAILYGLTWLGCQSGARWRRTDWNKASVQQLADELWTVMSRLRDPAPPQTQLQQPDGSVIDIDTGDIDFDFSDPPDTTETSDDDGVTQSQTIIEDKWTRTIVPCKVGTLVSSDPEGSGGTGVGPEGIQIYNVTLYPHGPDILTYRSVFDPRDGTNPPPIIEDETAVQLQIDTDELIPEDTWTLCCRITQTQISTTYAVVAGVPSAPSVVVSTIQSGNFLQIPVWL